MHSSSRRLRALRPIHWAGKSPLNIGRGRPNVFHEHGKPRLRPTIRPRRPAGGRHAAGDCPARRPLVLPVILDRRGPPAGARFRRHLLGHPRLPDAALLRHERVLQRDAAPPAGPRVAGQAPVLPGVPPAAARDGHHRPGHQLDLWRGDVVRLAEARRRVDDPGRVGPLGSRARGRPRRHRAAPGQRGGGQRPWWRTPRDAPAPRGTVESRRSRRAAHPARCRRERRRNRRWYAPARGGIRRQRGGRRHARRTRSERQRGQPARRDSAR